MMSNYVSIISLSIWVIITCGCQLFNAEQVPEVLSSSDIADVYSSSSESSSGYSSDSSSDVDKIHRDNNGECIDHKLENEMSGESGCELGYVSKIFYNEGNCTYGYGCTNYSDECLDEGEPVCVDHNDGRWTGKTIVHSVCAAQKMDFKILTGSECPLAVWGGYIDLDNPRGILDKKYGEKGEIGVSYYENDQWNSDTVQGRMFSERKGTNTVVIEIAERFVGKSIVIYNDSMASTLFYADSMIVVHDMYTLPVDDDSLHSPLMVHVVLDSAYSECSETERYQFPEGEYVNLLHGDSTISRLAIEGGSFVYVPNDISDVIEYSFSPDHTYCSLSDESAALFPAYVVTKAPLASRLFFMVGRDRE